MGYTGSDKRRDRGPPLTPRDEPGSSEELRPPPGNHRRRSTAAIAPRTHRQPTSSSRAPSEFALVVVALFGAMGLRLAALIFPCPGSGRRRCSTSLAGTLHRSKLGFGPQSAFWVQIPRKDLGIYLRELAEGAALRWLQ